MTYRLSSRPGASGVIREEDGATIPRDPANPDWQAFLAWTAAGNIPAPAPEPVSDPTVSGRQWALAIGDLGLASAFMTALASAKLGDRHRYGFVARDTRLRPDDPLLARICAGGRIDVADVVAHARKIPG